MRLRTVTSLNWLAGTLAIGAAALLPFVERSLSLDAARAGAEAAVQRLADAEKKVFPKYERFVFFSAQTEDAVQAGKAMGITIPSGDFIFDANADPENALVIRAFTSPAALQRGALPPMLYRYRVRAAGTEGIGEWTNLSGRSPGLQELPGSLAALLK